MRFSGEGSFDYREKDGLWRWRGSYKDVLTGKRKIKELNAKDKKVLKTRVEQWKKELSAGKQADILTADWVDIWLKTVVKPACKVKTYQNYEICVRNHLKPKFGGLWLSEITVFSLQNYFNELLLNHSARTVASIRTVFIVCFNSAIDYGYLITNPAKKTKPPKIGETTARALDPAEVSNLMKNLEPDSQDEGSRYLQECYYFAVKLAIETGMRQGEVFGLKWSSVNFEQNYLRVENNLSAARGRGGAKFETPKTNGSARNILLAETTVNDLKKWKQLQSEFAKKFNGIFKNVNNLVFTNIVGNPASRNNFLRRRFAPALKKSGIKEANFHTLRHTHASQLLSAGVDVQIVSQRLGHNNVSTTLNIYKHILKDIQNLAKDTLNQLYASEEADKKEIENE